MSDPRQHSITMSSSDMKPRSDMNLVPAAILQRVMRRRSSRIVWSLSVCVFLASGSMLVGASWFDARSTALENIARERGAPVVLLEEEIARLLADRNTIEARVDGQREVGVAIPAASIVRTIAQHLPSGTVLDRVSLEYANVQGATRRVRRSAKEVDPARELRGEIAGIALDESDVGRIVDAVGALTPVSRVALESSRSREFLGRNVREFRVTFAVDLEKRWALPPMAEASLAAHDTNGTDDIREATGGAP
ncbi:MAG: hypothetical protein RIR10_1488 [Planctomycetota bacterium]